MIFKEIVINKHIDEFKAFLYQYNLRFNIIQSYYLSTFFIEVQYQEQIDLIVRKLSELIKSE